MTPNADSRNEPEPVLPEDDGDDSGIDLDARLPPKTTSPTTATATAAPTAAPSPRPPNPPCPTCTPPQFATLHPRANAQPLSHALHVTRKLRVILAQLSQKQREVVRRDAELEGLRREIAQQRVELRGKEGQIACRDGRIGGLTEALAQRDAELVQRDAEMAQKDAEIAVLRQELEQRALAVSSSPEADAGSGDTEAELKSLRKANRKLTAQISGQWKTIATLRAVIGDAERRYGLLYPIEKAKVILGAVYGRDLHNKPLIMTHYHRFMRGDHPPPKGVSVSDLRTALEPLRAYLDTDGRNTVAHPSRDMGHLLKWDLDQIRARGSLEEIALHRTLVACAGAPPFRHDTGEHSRQVADVERDKRAPAVIYVDDSEDEEGSAEGIRMELEEGEIEESQGRKGKGKGKVEAESDEEVTECARKRRDVSTRTSDGEGTGTSESSSPESLKHRDEFEDEEIAMKGRPSKRLRR